MIFTTTNIVNQAEQNYLGIITGEAVINNDDKKLLKNIDNDLNSTLVRSKAYERNLRLAKQMALDEMHQRAEKLGTDAVVGVSIDYGIIDIDGMLMVVATGTAVKYH